MAATYLGISKTNFLARVNANELPKPRKIGERCLWDIRQLDAYADLLFSNIHTASDLQPAADNDEWGDIKWA